MKFKLLCKSSKVDLLWMRLTLKFFQLNIPHTFLEWGYMSILKQTYSCSQSGSGLIRSKVFFICNSSRSFWRANVEIKWINIWCLFNRRTCTNKYTSIFCQHETEYLKNCKWSIKLWIETDPHLFADGMGLRRVRNVKEIVAVLFKVHFLRMNEWEKRTHSHGSLELSVCT